MCDPLTAAAIAATVGGNFIQGQNNNASVKAQYAAKKNAMLQGLETQKAHQSDAANVMDPTVAGFSAPQQQTDLGNLITNRTEAINNNVTPATGNSDISTAPKVIQGDLAKRMTAAAGFGQQQGAALGKLGATNDQLLKNSLNVNAAQNKIGTINNFARADQAVNQAQQEQAFNNARKAPSMLGTGLSDLGTILGLASFGGAGNGMNAMSGPGAATFEQTSLPWRNTMGGFDIGPNFAKAAPTLINTPFSPVASSGLGGMY